jgi:hypothetical protein
LIRRLHKHKIMGNKSRLYIEAEGFVSTQENPAKKQNDTVLVIGRISRIDMQFDCNPQ